MAVRGRRFGIVLEHRLRSCMYETLGFKAPQFSSWSASASSRIGTPSSACIRDTQTIARQSQRPRAVAAGLKRIARPSLVRATWRELETTGQSSKILLRRASTDQPSEEAAKEGLPEGQEKQSKVDNEEQKVEKEEEEVVDEKTQTLRAALAHVPKFGWTEAAIIAGARDAGLSPAIAGAFPRKEAALVEFFMDECTQALGEELESREEELGKMVMQDRIATIVWMRLEMQVPYLPKWAQALSIQANPLNLPTTIKQRALLIDEIWHSAGDRSADIDWYAKRAILTGVYSTTELYMLTDTSPGFKESRAFLERRVNDALDCRKTVQEAGHLAQAVQAGLRRTVNSFLNRSQPPSGF